MDVAITSGKIYQVAPNISIQKAKSVVDVTGLYVTPGLIDMHVHAFQGNGSDAYIANGFTSLPPDGFTFRAGVTTVVDAGSSGWRNFRDFKKQTIEVEKKTTPEVDDSEPLPDYIHMKGADEKEKKNNDQPKQNQEAIPTED